MKTASLSPAFAPAAAVSLEAAKPQSRHLPAVPFLVITAIFLPEALGFLLGGFRLTASRLILLSLIPVILLGFPQAIASRGYRFVLSDVLVPLLGFWMIFAPSQIQGFDVGLKSGGAFVLDFVAPYALIRCRVQCSKDMHAAVRLFCILAAIAGVLAVPDTMTQSGFWRHQLAQLTGYTYFHGDVPTHSYLFRLGFYRAQSIFEHPIMLGIMMCYGLLLSRDVEGAVRLPIRIGCAIGLFLSLSAAPWDIFVCGLALTLYTRLFRMPHRWLPVIIGAGGMLAGILLLSSNPLGWIFNHLSMDPENGYFRLLTWQYAGHGVAASPVFGIGFGDNWFRPPWMPSTVDSMWLVMAMNAGIPGAVLLAASVLGAASLPAGPDLANGRLTARDQRLAETLGILLFLNVLVGFSVDLWGAALMSLAAALGMRAVIGQLANQ